MSATELLPATWLRGQRYPPNLDRLTTRVLRQQQGPQGENDMIVTPNTPTGMSVLVAPGRCIVDGSVSTWDQGSYVCVAADQKVLTIPAASTTAVTMHWIVCQVDDADYGSQSNGWGRRVIAGTPGAGLPPLPTNSVPLCSVNVPANATTIDVGNLTDVRVPAPATGLIQRVIPAAGAGTRNTPIVFDNIPQNGTDLEVRVRACAQPPVPGAGSFSGVDIFTRFNGNASTQYESAQIFLAGQQSGNFMGVSTAGYIAQLSSTNAQGNPNWSNFIIQIPRYSLGAMAPPAITGGFTQFCLLHNMNSWSTGKIAYMTMWWAGSGPITRLEYFIALAGDTFGQSQAPQGRGATLAAGTVWDLFMV